MMRFDKTFYEPHPDGTLLSVKIIPQSAMNGLGGIIKDSDGVYALKLKVTAPPEDGMANKAVIKLLAKTLHIPPSTIRIISGETVRKKTLLIHKDAGKIEDALIALIP